MQTEELTNLNSSELLNHLEEIRHHAREAGLVWAEKERIYKDLKELMPSFLAEFTAHHTGIGVNTTTARNRALADRQYQEKIKQMNIAEYEARLAEVEYKGWMESIKALTAISYVRNRELSL
jgi:DNA gyrase/topoisomerase IV subunit A